MKILCILGFLKRGRKKLGIFSPTLMGRVECPSWKFLKCCFGLTFDAFQHFPRFREQIVNWPAHCSFCFCPIVIELRRGQFSWGPFVGKSSCTWMLTMWLLRVTQLFICWPTILSCSSFYEGHCSSISKRALLYHVLLLLNRVISDQYISSQPSLLFVASSTIANKPWKKQ